MPDWSARFGRVAAVVANASGRPAAFVIAVALVLVWAGAGPFFDYSDTWQLYANTGTTLATFLMVFLLQNAQARDGAAVQAKLDELIHATERARDTLIGIERKPEIDPAALCPPAEDRKE